MDARIEPVDEIDVTVLVDNQTDSLSSVPGFVRQEWPSLVRAGMRELSGDCQCCANHGLALVVTARRGGTSRSMLFDTGPVGYALEGNGARLGQSASSPTTRSSTRSATARLSQAVAWLPTALNRRKR